MIGEPDIFPASFKKAITEPLNVIAPIATPSPISTRETVLICPSAPMMPNASGLRKAAAATSTAARPTSEWKAATSCGMSVILMRRAVTIPMTAPIPMAARISPTNGQSRLLPTVGPSIGPPTRKGVWFTSVVTTAISIPIMPKRLPRWLVAGLESPRSERMKHTPAIR